MTLILQISNLKFWYIRICIALQLQGNVKSTTAVLQTPYKAPQILRGQSMMHIRIFSPPQKLQFWQILPVVHNAGNLLITLLHGFACGPILPHSCKQYQDKPVLGDSPDADIPTQTAGQIFSQPLAPLLNSCLDIIQEFISKTWCCWAVLWRAIQRPQCHRMSQTSLLF